MTTIATRMVHISVNALTLEDVVRAVITGVEDGRGITFDLPSDAEVGDTMVVFSSAYAYAEPSPSENSAWYISTKGQFPLEGLPPFATPEYYPMLGLSLFVAEKLVISGEPGTQISLTYKPIDYPDDGDESTYTPSKFKPKGFMVVLKKSWVVDYNEYGETSWAYPEDSFGVDAISASVASVVFWVRTVDGGGETIPAIGATVLCDQTGDNSLYVGAKVAQTASSIDWPVDTGTPNIAILLSYVRF